MGMVLQATSAGNIGFWDVVDFLIAAYLVYVLFKLLRDSAAFNIFIGVLLVYVLWWTVRAMNMSILSTILDQFVSVGVIVLVIIFQPEIRRFLLVVGSTRLKERMSKIEKFIRGGFKVTDEEPIWVDSLMKGVESLIERKMDALLVIADKVDHDSYINSGVTIGAEISKELLISIQGTDSPLHDGAIILQSGKVVSAGCSLPTKSVKSHSDQSIPERAAMGISSQTNDFCIIIESDHGKLKYSVAGELFDVLHLPELRHKLIDHLNSTFAL